MDWDKLKTFLAAAETGSLTAAAERLALSQSAVSRQIAALEDELGMPLFHRHARGLLLTEQGQILQDTTAGMSERIALAQSRLRDSREKPFGPLRVTTTVALGSIWLTPRLVEFTGDYPDIVLDIMLTDKTLDLGKLEADCAIRLWRPTQIDLIQRKLFTVGQSLYASRGYLSEHGSPRSIADLDEHPIILYGASGPLQGVDWLATYGREPNKPRKPTLILDNIYGVMKAVQFGVGIAGLPDYVASGNPELVRVLPESHGPEFDIYFVYPEELRRSKRIKAFSDFLTRQTRLWRAKEI
jgi:DNA-binding transcriptional LysR family regulator